MKVLLNGPNTIILGLVCFILCSNTFADVLPGAETFSTELQDNLQKSAERKSLQFSPRTKHFDNNGQPRYTNRLIFEDSPYLLQHAHNPVNWYAWGDEAFAQAKKLNKPVFLSIGYSTCHWCHVMEKESFEDIEIARYLNEHFIAIKVDRERRPDVDKLYMTAVMLVKGQGGWPMSSFLLANGRPFYSDTYIPPDQFLVLLKDIVQSWHDEHEKIILFADDLSTAVSEVMQKQDEVVNIDDSVLQKAAMNILRRYDSLDGGFGGPIKFPNESLLLFLLQIAERKGNSEILAAVEHTLKRMAQGGIYDHIGGGFHRYSTDTEWRIPHFEKMLYNQANLARVYLYAYRLTGKQLYARVSQETLDYILRDMSSSKGGYYSASDADSEGREGAYFVWRTDEIKSLLDTDDARLAFEYYGLTDKGNFEGNNILYMPVSYDEFVLNNKPTGDLLRKIESIRNKLRKERSKRIKPLRAEKIIVAWNSMFIIALAKASRILNQPAYLIAAKESAEYLWTRQLTSDRELWRVNLNGKISIPAMQEDYACFSEAMITLYDVTSDQVWLDRAILLTNIMLDKFWDEQQGGFRMGVTKSLFTHPVDIHDSAIPSGNAIAMHVLVKLAQRTFNHRYQEYINKMLSTFSLNIHQTPDALPYMLAGLDEFLHGIAGPMDYAAHGTIRIESLHEYKNNSIQISLNIAPGWHINAYQPLQDYLIPMKLMFADNQENWKLENIKYPGPILKTLGFANEELALYEDKVQLTADLSPHFDTVYSDIRKLDLQLQLQACNDELCLPPEKTNLELTVLPR